MTSVATVPAGTVRSAYGSYHIVTDRNGRKYRVGESPEDITKRVIGYKLTRRKMLLGAWMCFFFGSVLEYGWGAASSTVISHYGWSTVAGFFNYTVYVLFEATVAAYIFSRMRERGLLSIRRMAWLGAAMLMISYIFFANAFAPWISYVGYAMTGGLASGIGYAAGGGIVTKWFPEKRGWRLGLANGAWAYGAVPFIIAYSIPSVFNQGDFQTVLYATGITISVGLLIASFLICDAPKNWWPADVDPLTVNLAKSKSKELKANPPAVAQFTPQEFFATRQGKAQMASFTLALAASLFNVALYAPYGAAMGLGGVAFTVGAAGFAFTDGIGRPTMGWISSIIGRRKAVTIFYLLMGLGGLGVLGAGLIHSAVLWAILAVLTGAVSGSCFVFDWLIISDYFGENYVATNWSIPYMLKVFGGAFGGIGATILLTLYSGGTLGTVLGTPGAPSVVFSNASWAIAFGIATLFAVIAAALVWFYEKQPTLEDYIKVRQKFGLSIPQSVGQAPVQASTPDSVSGGDE